MQGLLSSFELVCVADLGVVSRAFANGSVLCCAVDGNEAEARPEALVPFKVVEKRPVEITFDLGAVFDSPVDGCECARQKLLPECVASVGEAVFGDINGFAIRL